jgi:hypothetical protein
MPSINTISIDKLARLIGTPKCPVLIDIQADEDFAADPRLRRHRRDPQLARERAGSLT